MVAVVSDRCRNVRFGVSVSVVSNKVPVVIVLVETVSKYLISSVKLSGESQTSCAHLVRVRIVVAL